MNGTVIQSDSKCLASLELYKFLGIILSSKSMGAPDAIAMNGNRKTNESDKARGSRVI